MDLNKEPERIDQLLMSVVSMGFELEDAQQAVQMGKLTTEDVIEWILAGKPTQGSSQSATLKLGQSQSAVKTHGVIGSNPFANPQPSRMDWQPDASTSQASTASTAPDSQTDDRIKSRFLVNEEQRVVKEKFDEKQRLEAQKTARQEKMAQKKAKEEVLKRIREDRESAKAKRSNADKPSAEDNTKAAASESPPKSAKPEQSTDTMIQVRLPTGRSMRQRFSKSAPLREVVEHLREVQRVHTADMQLVQPFPRIVYGESDMEKTLEELQLTPSGSLVLNRSQPQAQAPPSPSDSVTTAAVPFSSPPIRAPPQHQLQPIDVQNLEGQDMDQSQGGQVGPISTSGQSGQIGGQLGQVGVPLGPSGQLGAQGGQVGQSGTIGTASGGTANQGQSGQPIQSTGPGQLPPGLESILGQASGNEPGHVTDSDSDDETGKELGSVQHKWGGDGHVLDDGNVSAAADVDSGGEEMEVEDDNAPVPIGQPGAVGPGHPIPQVLPMGAPAHAVLHDHYWGGGQSLIGQVLNQNLLPHKTKDPKRLAAEAASRRFVRASNEPVAMDTQPAHATVSIDTLVTLVLRHVCARMQDPRQPIAGLQGLPADLAMKILEHLIKERLLKAKTLQPFISCHLRSLVLDCYPYTTNELLGAIRLHTYLVHLSLVSCPLITDKGLLQLSSLKRLKTVNLSGCKQITDKTLTVMQDFSALTTLVMEDTGISDVGVTQYAQTSPLHLTSLNLNKTAVTHDILQALPAIPNLTVLNMEATQMASLSGIERLEKLECLNLANTPLVTDSLLLLRRCPRLTALNISDTPYVRGNLALEYITDLKLQYLQLPSRLTTTGEGLRFITDMPLQVLDLTNYINVGDNGIQYLSHIHSLRKLRLSNTKITDEGLVYLQALAGLEELLLDRTHVTDTGVALLAALTKLLELSLSETLITDELLVKQYLHGLGSLSKLNLNKTAISNTGIQALSLPSLSVLNIDRTYVTPDVANSLIDSGKLPALQSVTYRQGIAPPPVEEQ